MKLSSLTLLLACAIAPSCATPNPTEIPAVAPDAVQSNPEKYRVVFENDDLRVLDYRDKPGEKTHMHTHPDFVMCVLGPFQRKLSFPNGTSQTREFRGGEVISMQAQTHLGENIGNTDTHVLLVEMKPRR